MTCDLIPQVAHDIWEKHCRTICSIMSSILFHRATHNCKFISILHRNKSKNSFITYSPLGHKLVVFPSSQIHTQPHTDRHSDPCRTVPETIDGDGGNKCGLCCRTTTRRRIGRQRSHLGDLHASNRELLMAVMEAM